MEDNKNGNGDIPIGKRPSASRTESSGDNTKKSESSSSQSGGYYDPEEIAEIFKSVYQEKKKEKEVEPSAEEIRRQRQRDAQLRNRPVQPPIKSPVVTANPSKGDDTAFKAVYIFVIILTVVVFLASAAYLVFENMNLTKDSSKPGIPVNIESVKLSSPFDYTQTYDVTFPDGIQDKYKSLYAQSQDFVGWLNVPGTSIDSPVYQNPNNDYYLKHDNFGEYTKYGVPFLDVTCDPLNLNKNLTIYGHNFDNKLIFDEIQNYENLDFYRENPVIEFNTLYKDYKWKVIACFRSNGNTTGDNGYLFYYVAANMGNNSFMKLYNEIMQRSYIQTNVDVEPTDRFLTLSTCTYFFDRNGSEQNARFALVARLVRDGESLDVDTSGAVERDDVRYPQLYYDVFGGSNPYVNASKWIPESD